MPLLDAPQLPWKSAAFTQVVHGDAMGRSMRTDRYRFTRWSKAESPTATLAVELYDLGTDPVETKNIAADAENRALVKELTARLEAGWRAAQPEDTN